MTASGTPRLFVGLVPDEALRASLHATASAHLDSRDWRLVAAADLHLTLCFIGALEASRVPDLCAALHAELAGARAPELTLRGFGCVGEPAAPRVLWVGVSAGPAQLALLLELRRHTGRALARVAIAWDAGGPFNPHITVARPRRHRPLPAEFAAARFESTWRPAKVVLMTSIPGADPHYRALEAVALES